MKILVIDDNPIHQDAARRQLGGEHSLVTTDSYGEGQTILRGKGDFPEGFFDVVLVDLLMPAYGYPLADEGLRFAGKEMPVGIFLALLAAKKGAKYVAVLTDSDHHSHPASACFDAFNESESKPTPLLVENARVLLCNSRYLVQLDRTALTPEECAVAEDWNAPREKREELDGRCPRIKRWDRLLKYLLSPSDNI